MDQTSSLASSEASRAVAFSGDDAEAAMGFAGLEKSRQVLVFQTIQEAISSVPPRLEATFPSVVVAYTTLTEVVDAAKQGILSDVQLEKLENDIEAAGGVIAPGLWSQGDHSVAAFRSATFGVLKKNFSPQVVEAATAALNARLQSQKLNDLGRVFQAIAAFFSPLVPTGSNTQRLQVFNALDPERQVLVFRTLQDALAATPPRSDASFATVVCAYQSEQSVLESAAAGQLNDDQLATLESRIEAAGGLIAPAIYAQGKQSVASFRASMFKALQPLLPPEVYTASLSALNARLRDLKPRSLNDLFKAISIFFTPLLAQGWNNPTLQAFKALDPIRQTLVFRTIEEALTHRPELETTIFSAAVKAVHAEQTVVREAAAGNLTNETLRTMQDAIEDAGGIISPGIHATGEGSIGEFRTRFFQTLEQQLPGEVYKAAIAALNAKLSSVPINNLSDVISTTNGFMQPLMHSLLLTPLPVAVQSGDRQLEAGVEPIQEEAMLVPPLAQELPEGFVPDESAGNASAAPTLGVDDIQSLASSFSEELPTPQAPGAQSPNPGGVWAAGQSGPMSVGDEAVVDLGGDDALGEAKKNSDNPMS
jgi:hypothetical protein